MRLLIVGDATAQVANTSVNQFWFFVCVGKGASAVVRAAHISRDLARRQAKSMGGRVRGGHVDGNYAAIAKIAK